MTDRHGTRAGYQQGCPCLPCKAAEATYRQHLRRLKATGRQPLGALVPATEAWRRIRQLKAEQVTNRQLTGWRDRHAPLRTYTPALRVRLRTHLKLRALCRWHLLLDDDSINLSIETRNGHATPERAPEDSGERKEEGL